MALVLLGIFSETTCVYLSTKFQFPSIILKSYGQGIIYPPPPPPPHSKRTPKKSTQIRVKGKTITPSDKQFSGSNQHLLFEIDNITE